MGIDDLVAGLGDLSRNREALPLIILQGERAVPALAAGAAERRPSPADEAPTSAERRAEALCLLAGMGGKGVILLLLKALEDESPPVQLEAALGLVSLVGAQAPECALSVVARGLLHPDPVGAMRAVDALVEAGDCGIPHLLRVGPHRLAPAVGPRRPGDDTPQVTAIETLERIGTEASARALQEYLRDRSPLVRARAERALRHLEIPRNPERRHAAG